jgi:hypothetical protein
VPHITCLDVKKRPRTPEESTQIQAQAHALDLIARKAGFNSYGDLTRHFWDRLVAEGAETINTYPLIDQHVKDVIARAVVGFQAVPKRPR